MADIPQPTSRILLAVALVFLIAPFALYPQFLSDDALLYGLDSGQSHYARFRVLTDALQAEGRLPLWQITSYGGGPFHANPENPTLYPPVLILAAILPPLLAMNLTILVHLGIGALGMFLWTLQLWRRLGARGPPGSGNAPGLAGAIVAGTLFGFNDFTRLESFNLVTYGAAHALVPWVFLTAGALLHGNMPRRRAGALTLITALLVFTGGHYVFAYALLALVLWCAVDGLWGGPGPRRRALIWLPVAGTLTVVILMAKGLPFLDWVTTTNRSGALPLDVSRGVSLAGTGTFDWDVAWAKISERSNGFLTLAATPLLLLCFRRRTAWLIAGLGLLGLATSLGVLHEPLFAHLPPFDHIRGSLRAWTLVNIFAALASGLGLNALLALLARWKPRTLAPLDRWAGPVLALVALPWLLDTGRFQDLLDNPYSFRDVTSWYRNWPQAVAAAGPDGRVMSLSVRSAGTRNEQFIASALGAETTAGFFGHAYPEALARHVYDNYGSLAPSVRAKRLRCAGVNQVVYVNRPLRPADDEGRHTRPFPHGIDGTTFGRLLGARPRVFVPDRVLGIVGDRDDLVLHALYDSPGHQPDRVGLIAFERSDVGTDSYAAVDARVMVSSGGDEADAATLSVSLPLDDGERKALADLAARLSAQASGAKTSGERSVRFTRIDTHTVELERMDANRSRFLIVSELWALYGGWDVRAGDRAISQYRADAVATALFLRPGESVVRASYDPPAARLGFQLGGLGVAICLLLLLWPSRAPRDGTANARSS